MKLALLSNGIFPYEIGGIQKHSYFLAKGLAKREIYVDIYQTSKIEIESLKEYFTITELKYLNFLFIEFPEPVALPGHYIYASWLFSKRVYLELLNKKETYNAIYAQGFTSWYFVKNKTFRKILITNLHGLEMFQTSIGFKRYLAQLSLQIPAQAIIQNSRKQISLGGKLTDILYKAGAPKNSVIEIPNGIHSSWIRSLTKIESYEENKKLKLIFIGRYERRKGIEEFQDIINKTIDTLDYEVTFIGPIPKEKQIVHKNVTYAGLIKDANIIQSFLQKADVLVCPSYSEGMPTVILEAMVCGCAIIATDVGAVSTMVNHENGWLIKRDIKSGLENAINKLVTNTQEELNLKKNISIKKVSEKFTWEKIISNTIKEL